MKPILSLGLPVASLIPKMQGIDMVVLTTSGDNLMSLALGHMCWVPVHGSTHQCSHTSGHGAPSDMPLLGG